MNHSRGPSVFAALLWGCLAAGAVVLALAGVHLVLNERNTTAERTDGLLLCGLLAACGYIVCRAIDRLTGG